MHKHLSVVLVWFYVVEDAYIFRHHNIQVWAMICSIPDLWWSVILGKWQLLCVVSFSELLNGSVRTGGDNVLWELIELYSVSSQQMLVIFPWERMIEGRKDEFCWGIEEGSMKMAEGFWYKQKASCVQVKGTSTSETICFSISVGIRHF